MIGAILSGIAVNGAPGVFQALIILPILRALVDEVGWDKGAPITANVDASKAQPAGTDPQSLALKTPPPPPKQKPKHKNR